MGTQITGHVSTGITQALKLSRCLIDRQDRSIEAVAYSRGIRRCSDEPTNQRDFADRQALASGDGTGGLCRASDLSPDPARGLADQIINRVRCGAERSWPHQTPSKEVAT